MVPAERGAGLREAAARVVQATEVALADVVSFPVVVVAMQLGTGCGARGCWVCRLSACSNTRPCKSIGAPSTQAPRGSTHRTRCEGHMHMHTVSADAATLWERGKAGASMHADVQCGRAKRA